jgi:hypothetical protein
MLQVDLLQVKKMLQVKKKDLKGTSMTPGVPAARTQWSCFTSTKVQILTPRLLQLR